MSGIYRTAEGNTAVRQAYETLLARWPVEAERRTLATSLGETFVLSSGPEDAPAVIALAGSGGTTAHWLPHIEGLAQGLRVHAVDVPGEPGLSGPARPRLDSPEYAGWLDDVLAGLGLTEAGFLGASLGGWWALDYALRRPDAVTKLALLNPGGIGRRRITPLLKYAVLSLFGEWGRRRSLRMAAKGWKGPVDPETAALGAFLLETFRHFKPRMDPIPRPGDEQLRSLGMPVFALFGGQDALLDQKDGADRLRAARPDADVRFDPDAGHFLPDWPTPVAAFLAGTDVRA